MADLEKVIKGLQAHADGCGHRSHYCDVTECPYRYWDESCDIEGMCRDAITLLKKQEIKTGHWIVVEYETLTCSCCGESYYTGCDSTKEAMANLEKGNVYRYCPHCGAKMEGR